jgi:hypothetical protein
MLRKAEQFSLPPHLVGTKGISAGSTKPTAPVETKTFKNRDAVHEQAHAGITGGLNRQDVQKWIPQRNIQRRTGLPGLHASNKWFASGQIPAGTINRERPLQHVALPESKARKPLSDV